MKKLFKQKFPGILLILLLLLQSCSEESIPSKVPEAKPYNILKSQDSHFHIASNVKSNTEIEHTLLKALYDCDNGIENGNISVKLSSQDSSNDILGEIFYSPNGLKDYPDYTIRMELFGENQNTTYLKGNAASNSNLKQKYNQKVD